MLFKYLNEVKLGNFESGIKVNVYGMDQILSSCKPDIRTKDRKISGWYLAGVPV